MFICNDIIQFSIPTLLSITFITDARSSLQSSSKPFITSQQKMPVIIEPANHPARKWTSRSEAAGSAESLFKESCPVQYKKYKGMIRASVDKFSPEEPLHSSENGFVRAAVAAYCGHHHLTLRPEDIWFAILTQLNLYINAHAEELRSFFVAHPGQKELVIKDVGTIVTADFGDMARRMSKLMGENVVDPELLPWIMPSFSTTTETDQVIASVIMMGALQKYFYYTFQLQCGIPSVTLLGVQADWQEILQRLDKIPNLGPEASQFHDLLKPVLTRFVKSFDCPNSSETKDFWQKIADRSGGGSGPQWLSGWITAFCFWDEDGKSLHALTQGAGCRLDGTDYHRVNMDKIPSGHSSVPVKLDDNGRIYDTIMVAGSMGIRVRSTGMALDETYTHANSLIYHNSSGKLVAVEHRPGKPQGEPGLDSVQPESGWFMFERKAEVEDEGSPVGRGGVRVGRGTSEVKRSWASLRLGKSGLGKLVRS